MNTPLYTFTIPVFINTLEAVSAFLDKATVHASLEGKDPNEYLSKQLAPDQFPLVRQVQVACDSVRMFAYRMKGDVPPSVPDTETTIEELQTRIQQTLTVLKGVTPEDIQCGEEAHIRLQWFPGKHFTGLGYITTYVMPNFFFHVTTAYAILRHNGVPLGKMDYLGQLALIND